MSCRACCWLLISSLAAVRAPAEDLDLILDDVGMDCRTLAEAQRDLLQEVAGEVEERLRRSEAGPPSVRELAGLLGSLPAWSPAVSVREDGLHSLVGDLFLFTGRLGPAMAAYGRAAEAGPVSAARCGVSYGGVVYTFEVLESVGHSPAENATYYRTTPYLLVRDPATGHVRERILLPALPAAMALDGGDLQILLTLDRVGGEPRPELRSVDLAELRLEDPFELPTDLQLRWRSRNASKDLVVNFIWGTKAGLPAPTFNPEFTLRSDVLPGRPADLEALEAALRRAVLEDPTQPWHLFYLGQCLWAGGRSGEATEVWEDLLAGTYPGIPYYEYAGMAQGFELHRQPEWADAAFRAALERRRRLPFPVEWGYHMDRFINVPASAVSYRTTDLWPERDAERAYLWWLRVRELSGVVAGDAFRAVLWASYFKSVGDSERAAAELEYLDRVRRYPWLLPLYAYCDYTMWFLIASSAGFVFVLVVLVVKASKRLFPWPLSGRHRYVAARRLGTRLAWLRRSGIVLVPLLILDVNLMALSFEFWYFEVLYSGPLVPADVSENRAHSIDDPGAFVKFWIRTQSWRPWLAPYEVLSGFSFRYRLIQAGTTLDSAMTTLNRIMTSIWLPWIAVAVVLVLLNRRFRGVVRRLVQFLVPGAVFLRRGQLLRAYFSVWLFFFAFGPLLWIVRGRATEPPTVSPGFLSDSADVSADFTTPRPGLDELVAESFWSLLWAFPLARPFYALVAAALSAVLYLQCREPLKDAWAVARTLREKGQKMASPAARGAVECHSTGREGAIGGHRRRG